MRMNTSTTAVFGCFLLAVIAAIFVVQKSRSRAAQIILAALLLLPTGFCVFGFMATFEPMEAGRQLSFRIGYVVLGVVLALSSGLLLMRPPVPRDQVPDEASSSGTRLSTALLFCGVICLAIGLMPNGKKYTDAATSERVTRWRIGLEFSPIYEYTRRESDNGMKFESGLRLLAWSWLPVAVGAVLLELRRQRNRHEPRPPAGH